MNVPGWKNAWWRRAQLLWIVPYLVVAYVPFVIGLGIREVGNPFWSLVDVWKGRR